MMVYLCSTTLPDSLVNDFKSKKLLVINTAINPYRKENKDISWYKEQIKALEMQGFEIKEIDIENAEDREFLEQNYKNYDGFYLSGGNSFYLNYWIERFQLYKVLKKFKYAIGSSAGAIALTPDLTPYDSKKLDDSSKSPSKYTAGLNFAMINILVHADNSKYQEGLVQVEKFYKTNSHFSIQKIKDGECLKFENVNKFEIFN